MIQLQYLQRHHKFKLRLTCHRWFWIQIHDVMSVQSEPSAFTRCAIHVKFGSDILYTERKVPTNWQKSVILHSKFPPLPMLAFYKNRLNFCPMCGIWMESLKPWWHEVQNKLSNGRSGLLKLIIKIMTNHFPISRHLDIRHPQTIVLLLVKMGLHFKVKLWTPFWWISWQMWKFGS